MPYFSSSTPTEKHITSNLSEAVTARVITSIDKNKLCSDIVSVSYTPKNGETISPSYDCDQVNDIMTLDLVINTSASSNVLIITYATASGVKSMCDGLSNGIGNFGTPFYTVIIFIGVMIVLAAIITLIFMVKEGTIEMSDSIEWGAYVFIGIFVLIIIFFVVMYASNLVCNI